MRRRIWLALSLALLVFAGWLAFLHFEPRLFPLGVDEERFMVDVPAFSGYLSTQGAVLSGDWSAAGEFDEEGMARVERGDRYGWIDRRGNVVIPIEWENFARFNRDGMAAAQGDGRWIWVDRRGIRAHSAELNPVVGLSSAELEKQDLMLLRLKEESVAERLQSIIDRIYRENIRVMRLAPGRAGSTVFPIAKRMLPGDYELTTEFDGHPLTDALWDRFPSVAKRLENLSPFSGRAILRSPSGAVVWRSDLHYFRFLLLPAAGVLLLLASLSFWRYRVHRRRVS